MNLIYFASYDIASVSSTHLLTGKSSLLKFKSNAVYAVHFRPNVRGGGHMAQENYFELRFHVGSKTLGQENVFPSDVGLRVSVFYLVFF